MKQLVLVFMVACSVCGMNVGLRQAMWDDGVENSVGETLWELPELETQIPMSWLAQYPELLVRADGDSSTALRLVTGKHVPGEGALFVWHDYLTGCNPLDTNDVLTAFITVQDDVPEITWTPNLNTNGIKRIYTIWGKTNLVDGAWMAPTNSAHKFFKVTVEMP